MTKGSPPASPDYQSLAQQQGQQNIDLAKMQQPNVIGPNGTQTVTYSGPVEQTQANFDANAYLAANPDVAAAVSRGGQQYGDGNGGVIDPVTSAWQHYQNYGMNEGRAFTPMASASGNIPTITQTLSPEQKALQDQQNQIKGLLGGLGIQGAQSLQGTVGKSLDFGGAPITGNYDATRNQVINAYMSRANEDYAKQSDQSNSNLVAAGIRPGSKAYGDQQQMIERSRNDARQQAEIQGGNAAQQAYGVDADRRNRYIAELLQKRSVPLNEITALMSGGQVSNPFAMPNPGGVNGGQSSIMEAGQLGSDYLTSLYNQQAASAGQFNSGLFGLGAAGLAAMSDRRLKSNIARIGTHPLGIGIYEYNIAGRRERGVMADELEAVRPDAVTMIDGYKAVFYDRIPFTREVLHGE